MSRMYMNGTLRSWMHYVDIRCDEATQKEHREVADQCKAILTDLFPSIYGELRMDKQYYHFKKSSSRPSVDNKHRALFYVCE
jgi:thymidylate synthase ThyX